MRLDVYVEWYTTVWCHTYWIQLIDTETLHIISSTSNNTNESWRSPYLKKRVQNWLLDLRWNFCLSKGFLKESKIWTTLRGPNISQLGKATSSWTSKVPVLGGYVRSQEGSYWNSKHWNTSNWAIQYLEWLMAGPVEPNKLLDLDRKTSEFSGNKICMADLDHAGMLCPLLFPLKWFHGTILLKHWWKMNKINQPWKDWICDSPHLGGLS